MGSLRKTLTSSIGAKSVMAVTGLALLGFVVAHMLGNLQVFAGQDKLNAYAATLQGLGPGLWVMRLGLLAIFLVHGVSAFRLTRLNKAARPDRYVKKVDVCTTYAARTMWMSGLIVLAFVIYHLLHFTLHVTSPGIAGFTDAMGRPDVAKMVVLGFRSVPTAAVYVIAQLLLALHISHGAKSAFQTLGIRHPRLAFLEKGFGPAVAVIIAVGNISIPAAILAGFVPKGVVL